MTLHSSMIGSVTVTSRWDYIVYGSVRGLVGRHKSIDAARLRADRDRRDCASLGGGAYSDVSVYRWDDGWVLD